MCSCVLFLAVQHSTYLYVKYQPEDYTSSVGIPESLTYIRYTESRVRIDKSCDLASPTRLIHISRLADINEEIYVTS